MYSYLISIIFVFLLVVICVEGVYEWSFQQRITVPEANGTYGLSPSFLVGRGFITLVTGYNTQNPGVYVHTTDDGYLRNGQYVWSQQAKLIAQNPGQSVESKDQFGKWLVAKHQTIIISAPMAGDRRGFAYVFNGTLRHWSQIQRLIAAEGTPNDFFGERMSLHNDRLVVSARGVNEFSGAVYVFERPKNTLYWSRQARLVPRDAAPAQHFGAKLDLFGETCVVTSQSDDIEKTGSAYIYSGSGGAWSQQQKLISIEMQKYKKGESLETLDLTFGDRYLGRSVSINNQYEIFLGISNVDPDKPNRDSVYVFKTTTESRRWSLQQKLFYGNDTTTQISYGAEVYSDRKNVLYTTVVGPDLSSTYVFKSFGNGWSMQSRILSYNLTFDEPFYDVSEGSTMGGEGVTRPAMTNFSLPSVWGGTLIHSAGNEIQMRSKFGNESCLRIWMSDHFLDGWDTAVLTVRAPDLTNDTFHPHCDQIDPFYVRYCPFQPEDEGVYIFKVFAATQARFFWEVSWQVQEEKTGKVYRGDFATKMFFNFNSTSMAFTMVGAENLIDLEAPCYRCTRIALRRWAQQQTIGDSAFWPLVVTGAPYYISDYQGRVVYSTGKVCEGVTTYECYQTVPDGLYILRLGGGLFGRITGFPYPNATWTGCGNSGTDRDQLIFRIANGVCTSIQKHRYDWRCDRPSIINVNSYSNTKSPMASGTIAPSQNVFGEPHVKGQMYAKSHHQVVDIDGADNTAPPAEDVQQQQQSRLALEINDDDIVEQAQANGILAAESNTAQEELELQDAHPTDPHGLPHPVLHFP